MGRPRPQAVTGLMSLLSWWLRDEQSPLPHTYTRLNQSQPILASGNGNVNLIHGRSSEIARPEDSHPGRLIPWEELRLSGCRPLAGRK